MWQQSKNRACILATQVFGAGDKSSIIQLLRKLWSFAIKMAAERRRSWAVPLKLFLVWVIIEHISGYGGKLSIIELLGETL